MEHLNLCRQLVKQYNQMLSVPSLDGRAAQALIEVLTLVTRSEKFLLPLGGLVIDDLEMRDYAVRVVERK